MTHLSETVFWRRSYIGMLTERLKNFFHRYASWVLIQMSFQVLCLLLRLQAGPSKYIHNCSSWVFPTSKFPAVTHFLALILERFVDRPTSLQVRWDRVAETAGHQCCLPTTRYLQRTIGYSVFSLILISLSCQTMFDIPYSWKQFVRDGRLLALLPCFNAISF